MPLPIYDATDFGAGILRLAPTGRAWSRDEDAVSAQVLRVQGAAYARLHARSNYLAIDAFPATAVELLPEWEYTLGLPDPCEGPDATIALRQAHVVARLTLQNGPSIPSLISYAATLGYAITIQEFAPSRFGQPFGQSFGGEAWAYTWQITAPSLTIDYFRFGQGRFGDPFATFGNTVLICEMNRIKPAHTLLQFVLGGVLLPTPPVVPITAGPVVSISPGVLSTAPVTPVVSISAGALSTV